MSCAGGLCCTHASFYSVFCHTIRHNTLHVLQTDAQVNVLSVRATMTDILTREHKHAGDALSTRTPKASTGRTGLPDNLQSRRLLQLLQVSGPSADCLCC